MSEDSNVRDVLEITKAIVEEVPIYEDALQPACKELGKGLETIAKSINMVLAPIGALVWGYDKIRDFIDTTLPPKMANIPIDRINQNPNLHVIGPALESLKYTGHNDDLRELYANLLVTTLDLKTAESAHPSFVDIIKNLSSDEAKILKFFSSKSNIPVIDLKSSSKNNQADGQKLHFKNYSHIGVHANCSLQSLVPTYLENLRRLGLLEIPWGIFLNAKDAYDELLRDDYVKEFERQLIQSERILRIDKTVARTTNYGTLFIKACVLEKIENS